MLRHAIEVFNRQGYDGTSVADLAAGLGVGKSAIYHHWPSKEALLAAALDEALDGLTRAVDSPVGDTATDRLRSVVRASVAILVEHLPAVTLLLRVHGNSEVELDALRRRRALDDALASLVADAAAEGGVRDDLPPDLVSRLLFGTVNSLVEWYRPGGPVDARTLADAVGAMVFEGLGAPHRA